jgi:hypothetical protein
MLPIIMSALVAAAPVTHAYDVTIRNHLRSGSHQGAMTLTIASGGIATGTWRLLASAQRSTFDATVNGKKIYFDLPGFPGVHFSGEIRPNGEIDASGFAPRDTRHGRPVQFILTAAEKRSPR